MGFQVKGDRQKGSRVSLFGGRQMGPRFFMLVLKRNCQMGFQVD
jgi:UDP-N-acetylglucosamine enolpyruvyl transferase